MEGIEPLIGDDGLPGMGANSFRECIENAARSLMSFLLALRYEGD